MHPPSFCVVGKNELATLRDIQRRCHLNARVNLRNPGDPVRKAGDTGVDAEETLLGTAFAPADDANLGPAGGQFVPHDQGATAVTVTGVDAAFGVTSAEG